MSRITAKVVDRDGYVTKVALSQVNRSIGVPGLSQVLQSLREEPSPSGTCPLCGYTTEQYQATGLLGCGLCYSSIYQK